MFQIKDISNYTIEELILSKEKNSLELLKDLDEFDEDNISKVRNKIKQIAEFDLVPFTQENILPEIEKIIHDLPKNISNREKVRFIYINLGKLFSYDYRVAYDMRYAYEEAAYTNKFIGRYQTCIQISEILNWILNMIDGVESKIITRSLDHMRGAYGEEHKANEVKIKIDDNTYETYLLDLTLDLYLIQSGCKTKHFGFESNIYAEYDIIPQIENIETDQKLGLRKGSYTDDIIKKVKEQLNSEDFQQKEEKNKLNLTLWTINSLLGKFNGYHEGKQFLNLLFKELLKANYKEFNIYYLKDGETPKLRTCYKIEINGYTKWIFYSNVLGLVTIDQSIIKDMLENGWETKSKSLEQEIFTSNRSIR